MDFIFLSGKINDTRSRLYRAKLLLLRESIINHMITELPDSDDQVAFSKLEDSITYITLISMYRLLVGSENVSIVSNLLAWLYS